MRAKPLVIVEASGKRDALRRALSGIGLHADVVATVGHIASNPNELRPISLDESLRETAYALRADRASVASSLREAISASSEVFIATDADQEGDVIASDISRLFADALKDRPVCRVRLRAIADSELRASFSPERRVSLDRVSDQKGAARRIVDRAIGATYSRAAEQIAVGRVQSSLLSALSKHKAELGRFALSVKLKGPDGPEVLWASVPVTSLSDCERLERAQAALDEGHAQIVSVDPYEAPASRPWGFEDVLLEASRRLKIGVSDAEKALQAAYEKGRVSYPRVRANAYSAEAVKVGQSLAELSRTSFNPNLLPTRPVYDDADGFAHESLRPIDDGLQLGMSLSVLDSSEAIAVLVARNLLLCGQKNEGRAIRIKSDDLGEVVFHSIVGEHHRGWRDPKKVRGYEPYTPEQAVLKFMAQHNLGRPSTVVSHVTKVLGRSLLDDSLQLTAKGRRWLSAAQEAGIDDQTSIRVEKMIEEAPSNMPASELAQRVLSDLQMLDRVLAVVRADAPERITPVPDDAPVPSL